MSKIVFFVPRGRAFCGRAMLVGADGATRAGPFRALATASVRVARTHGNADASPLLPFGHPPSGTYVIAASLPPGYVHAKRKRRYGRVGGLLLAPQSGDALAATQNGRKLVAVHGGPRDPKRRLRPTRGGIRLSNTHMKALLVAINDAQHAGDPVASVEVHEVDLELLRRRDKKGGRAVRVKAKKGFVAPLFLLPFALGRARRRDVLQAAAIAFGALAIQACDRPTDCVPLGCPAVDGGRVRHRKDAGTDAGTDAGDGGDDAGCVPQGYQCSGGVG